MVMEELKFQSSDDVSRSRIKRDINAIYLHEVAPFKRWNWLLGHTSIEHKAVLADGTVTVTPDSQTITFSTAPQVSKKNYLFKVNDFNEIYRITAHTAGQTTATISSAYTGQLNTVASYKVWTDTLALPTDCRETVEIYHAFDTENMVGIGIQEFRRIVNEQGATVQKRPRYYSTYDFVDPSEGDGETESDRYRALKIFPAVFESSTTINIDYIKDIEPLDLDGDEPLMPINDRIALVYGALSRAWARERNPDESTKNYTLFQNKLGLMAGKMEDSRDTPQIVPRSEYFAQKRGPRPTKRRGANLDGGSYSSPTYLKNVTIEGALITANITVNPGITIDGRDISADGTALDSIGTVTSQIDTANRVVITDSAAKLEESAVTSSELLYLEDVEALTPTTILDNQASPGVVATWPAADYDDFIIMYSLKRGTANRESGIIHMVTDGSSVAYSINGPNLGTLGTTFTADISGANVRLLAETTNTGTNVSMKYYVRKWLG